MALERAVEPRVFKTRSIVAKSDQRRLARYFRERERNRERVVGRTTAAHTPVRPSSRRRATVRPLGSGARSHCPPRECSTPVVGSSSLTSSPPFSLVVVTRRVEERAPTVGRDSSVALETSKPLRYSVKHETQIETHQCRPLSRRERCAFR